jgi:hypothetical protein
VRLSFEVQGFPAANPGPEVTNTAMRQLLYEPVNHYKVFQLVQHPAIAMLIQHEKLRESVQGKYGQAESPGYAKA